MSLRTASAPRATTGPSAKAPLRKTRKKLNVPAGVAGFLWLAVVILPIYYVVITSFKDQQGFFASNPFLPAEKPTLANYQLVLENDFFRYLANSLIVTAGAVLPAVLISFMAAYAIVRGSGRLLTGVSRLFLLGLAIPLQATIIPIYWGITKLYLYDSLLALILPGIAFAVPVSVLILANFLRDVPNELFESMRLDGCSDWSMMWRLAFPLIRPAIVTIAIYNALNVWNSFLFPLILTQSAENRVLPLSLWAFQGEFTINTPAILAAVVLSALPLVFVYVVGRRQLVAGLTAGFSK
ncbi:ABC transporter permease [Arthrobacter sp. MYb23]|uniref:carbohydrate ABC transporter permease n=1 Tax=unclassified Arthrobacter TaxID=235627 RepID=UPI000CFD00A2|nr:MULTISPECIES: carbohydrate ABC transporter permease [unclassified Arthrobacter]PRB43471.1 ABC transporter permease [Arthrobacter sp. MYb51]PRB93715.1 ABC transporter permease [Arthrobacter sp. MYb23]